jgi:hypothetical protein
MQLILRALKKPRLGEKGSLQLQLALGFKYLLNQMF